MRGLQAGLWAIATLASFSGAFAQQGAGRVVLDAVDVRGLERVSESLVRSQIEVKPGNTLDPRAVQRDIRRLYALGYFATISAELEQRNGQNVVVYIVVEEKFIDEVRIQGNKKINVRQIRGAISWHEGQAFVREGYGEERDAVLDLYRSKGFLNATVDIIVEPIAPSRVRVTYQIDEGKKARIKSIDFIGNEALTERKLKDVIVTRRAFWFFGGRYDEARFETDLLKVINEYANVGRLEAEIAETDFQYGKNGKSLHIDILVAEGPEYRIGNITTANNFVYSNNELLPLIDLRAGDVHNRGQILQDGDEIVDLYTISGYVNAGIVPQVTLNRDALTTNVTYQVTEDELKYIREVRITGNSVTRDDVIRRNVLLKPGDRYDGKLRDFTLRRLEQTQFFGEPPRLRLEGDDENSRFTNALIDVVEGKTGDFNFGLAFNTEDGFGGFGELRLRNFDITNWPELSGGGQILSARFFIGTERTNFRVGITDPDFFGYPFSLGVEAFDERYRATGAADYSVETSGIASTLTKRLSNYNTMSLILSARNTELDDIDTFVDPELRELEDPGSTLSLTLGLNRNTTNSLRDPTRGGDHTLTLEVAGGLDNEFVQLNHDSTWFYGPNRWPKIGFSFRTREGISFAFGDKDLVPISDRFFAGGSTTLRGYDFRDVGPKAQTFEVANGQVFVDDQPIGGELRILNTIEAKYILSDIIRLYVFSDAGAVFFQPEDFDLDDWRFSVGVGVGISVPFLGPIRLDYGYPLNPDDEQSDGGQIHLQSSISF